MLDARKLYGESGARPLIGSLVPKVDPNKTWLQVRIGDTDSLIKKSSLFSVPTAKGLAMR